MKLIPVLQLLGRCSLPAMSKMMSVYCLSGLVGINVQVGVVVHVAGWNFELCSSNARVELKKMSLLLEQSKWVHRYRFSLLHKVWSRRWRELAWSSLLRCRMSLLRQVSFRPCPLG